MYFKVLLDKAEADTQGHHMRYRKLRIQIYTTIQSRENDLIECYRGIERVLLPDQTAPDCNMYHSVPAQSIGAHLKV